MPTAATLAAKGGAAFKAGELDEAASLFSQALEIVERNGEVTVDSKHALTKKGILLNRSAVLLKLGNQDEFVVDDCAGVLELEPDNAKALFRRARALANLGKWIGAEKDAEAAVVTQPGAAGLLTEIRAKLAAQTDQERRLQEMLELNVDEDGGDGGGGKDGDGRKDGEDVCLLDMSDGQLLGMVPGGVAQELLRRLLSRTAEVGTQMAAIQKTIEALQQETLQLSAQVDEDEPAE